jgi:O-antigen ligase
MGLPILSTAVLLFLAAMAATLTIGFRDPRMDYAYECVLFGLGAYWIKDLPAGALPLATIPAWGFAQLALGATVYRYATLQSSLRYTALATTAWIAWRTLGSRGLRDEFLRAFAWLGALVAVTSVLAYFTSPGKILWMFDAPYPDVWGPFLSRNNFAQFLELAVPVALWLGLREPRGSVLYMSLGAIMLASGLASASRAGSAILVLEALAILWIRRKSSRVRPMALGLVLATALFAAMPGISHLAGRLQEPDPYQGRREISHSALTMIASRPWTGFGLGTFAAAYPSYAIFDTGHTVEHAHNDWLEWAAEGGIPYAAIWLGLAIWAVRPALRTVWGIGILACLLHGLVDYPLARLGISAWIFLWIGMLATTDLREVSHRPH